MDKIILKAENIGFSYGSEPFMENIGFCVNKGELISLIGENGCGKSTLLHILNGDFRAKSGIVYFEGKDISALSKKQRAKRITTIYQNIGTSFPFACFDIVSMGLYPHKGAFQGINGEDADFITEIMEQTDTLSFAEKNITELSAGERQRVMLAKALAQKPRLMLLDEAMSNLDISAKIKIILLLRKICEEKNITVIMISHDLSAAFEYSHRLMAMKKGGLLYFDTAEKLANEEFFKTVFGVRAEIFQNNRFFIHNIY